MQDQLRDFDKVAINWDKEPRRVQLARAVSDAIIQQVVPGSEMRTLDFGSGTGLVTLALAPLVRELVAADSSAGMLEQLTVKLSESNINNVRTFQLDHEGIVTLPGPFDLVVSSMTMHHISDVGALLKRFRAVMSFGAQLCIADLESEDGHFHDDPTGIQHHGFTVEEMELMFREAGFGSIRTVRVSSITKQRGVEISEYPINLTIGHVED